MMKHPIEYNKEAIELDESLIKELELAEPVDDKTKGIYDTIFNKRSVKFEDDDKELYPIDKQVKYITTDKSFLKSTQNILKRLSKVEHNTDTYEEYNKEWREFNKEDTLAFQEKYMYIDWTFAEKWNYNPIFLQLMSIYNILSPLTSLLIPFILLLIPFFIIHFKGYSLTLEEYSGLLKKIFANHTLGKLFDLQNSEGTNKLYTLVVIFFYFMNIYQSVLTCIRFQYNNWKIHQFLKKTKEYCHYTISKMEEFHLIIEKENDGYEKYSADLLNKRNKLDSLVEIIDPLVKHSIYSANYMTNLGNTLKIFYELHELPEYKELLEYSFEFHIYYSQMLNISDKLEKGVLNFAKYKKTNKVVFNNIHYPIYDKNVVKNNLKIDKNIIITGANASGKTTIIKSVLINLILSQQIGCGFYTRLVFQPFNYFYSYINIPDTLGRDSLFQAEARRCKIILDNIEREGRHFCIFDELYSGTNPVEAIESANYFIQYLNYRKNVVFLLTTHYNELCKNQGVNNMFMLMDDYNNYTYKIKNGINDKKCVLKIFNELNYPKEILNKFIR
jgi:hypothetical protein